MVAARDPQRGAAAAESLGARFVQLDVTDDESVEAAAELVADAGGLDVLINNAGIAGGRTPVADTTAADVGRVFETNVLGAVRVMRVFTALLDASPAPVVVNVSSGLGSLGLASDPEGPYAALNMLAYPASKAALNMLTIQWAKAYPRWRINAADPGPTSTDLNAHQGTRPSRKEPAPSSDWLPSDRTVRRLPSPIATASRPGDGHPRALADSTLTRRTERRRPRSARNTLRGRSTSRRSRPHLSRPPRETGTHRITRRWPPSPRIWLPGERAVAAVAVAFGGPDVAPQNSGRAIVGQGGEVHAGLRSLGG